MSKLQQSILQGCSSREGRLKVEVEVKMKVKVRVRVKSRKIEKPHVSYRVTGKNLLEAKKRFREFY